MVGDSRHTGGLWRCLAYQGRTALNLYAFYTGGPAPFRCTLSPGPDPRHACVWRCCGWRRTTRRAWRRWWSSSGAWRWGVAALGAGAGEVAAEVAMAGAASGAAAAASPCRTQGGELTCSCASPSLFANPWSLGRVCGTGPAESLQLWTGVVDPYALCICCTRTVRLIWALLCALRRALKRVFDFRGTVQ